MRQPVDSALVDEGYLHRRVAALHRRAEEADHLGGGVDARVAVGVALELEQPLPGQGLDLRPGEERVRVRPVAGSGAVRHAAGHDEHDALHAVALQQRLPDAPQAAAAVVEGEHDRPFRRRTGSREDVEILRRRQGAVAVAGQVLQLAAERSRLEVVEDEDGHVAGGQRASGDEGWITPQDEVPGDFADLPDTLDEAHLQARLFSARTSS